MRKHGPVYKEVKREKAIAYGNVKLPLARPVSQEEQLNYGCFCGGKLSHLCIVGRSNRNTTTQLGGPDNRQK